MRESDFSVRSRGCWLVVKKKWCKKKYEVIYFDTPFVIVLKFYVSIFVAARYFFINFKQPFWNLLPLSLVFSSHRYVFFFISVFSIYFTENLHVFFACCRFAGTFVFFCSCAFTVWFTSFSEAPHFLGPLRWLVLTHEDSVLPLRGGKNGHCD